MGHKAAEPERSVVASFVSSLALFAGAGVFIALGLFAASAYLGSGQPPPSGPAQKVGPMLSERAALPLPKPAPVLPEAAAPAKPSEPQTVRVQSGNGRVQTFFVSPAPDDEPDTESTAAAEVSAPEPEPVSLGSVPSTPAEPRCTKFRSYDPQSRTYRGLDNKIRDCKPGGPAAGLTPP